MVRPPHNSLHFAPFDWGIIIIVLSVLPAIHYSSSFAANHVFWSAAQKRTCKTAHIIMYLAMRNEPTKAENQNICSPIRFVCFLMEACLRRSLPSSVPVPAWLYPCDRSRWNIGIFAGPGSLLTPGYVIINSSTSHPWHTRPPALGIDGDLTMWEQQWSISPCLYSTVNNFCQGAMRLMLALCNCGQCDNDRVGWGMQVWSLQTWLCLSRDHFKPLLSPQHLSIGGSLALLTAHNLICVIVSVMSQVCWSHQCKLIL